MARGNPPQPARLDAPDGALPATPSALVAPLVAGHVTGLRHATKWRNRARPDAVPDSALRCNNKTHRYSPAQGPEDSTSSAAAASTGTLVSGLSDKAAKPRASEDMLGFSMNTQGLPLRLQWFFTRQ